MDSRVPSSLRTWFSIHFVADILFGVPLLLAPVPLMRLFGWETVDPFTARLVGAALMGIGWESLLGRKGGLEQFRGMLRLKLIWSGSAVIGMTWTLLAGTAPVMGWVIVGIFLGFFGVWGWYYRRLGE